MSANDPMTNNPAQKPPGPPRQAVVLIHGIGEQRPMQTLRGFVSAFLRNGTYHSKPDTISDSYELRRLKLRRYISTDPKTESVNPEWPETDFYEYYWAHQMYGTKLSHVASWLWRVMRLGLCLILSSSERVHRRLRWIIPLIWLLLIAVPVAAYLAYYHYDLANLSAAELAGIAIVPVAAWVALRSRILSLLTGVTVGVFTDFAGDAARYFDVNPKNVTRRYDIIRGGVAMLRKLHNDCDEEAGIVMYRYGRIILLGHSLGSVIAYDILRNYWQDVNGKIEIDPAKFHAVENFCGGNDSPEFAGAAPYSDAKQFQANQRAAWRHLSRDKPAGVKLDNDKKLDARWLVTDLVTLGSPLTYAPLFLADGLADFESKQRLRELPICPPDRSRHLNKGHFTVKLSAELERIHDYEILPQGAHFAVTRWTNFYYDNDWIGGPLAKVFGTGIEDFQLAGPPLRPVTAHIGYWNDKLAGAGPGLSRLGDILRGTDAEAR